MDVINDRSFSVRWKRTIREARHRDPWCSIKKLLLCASIKETRRDGRGRGIQSFRRGALSGDFAETRLRRSRLCAGCLAVAVVQGRRLELACLLAFPGTQGRGTAKLLWTGGTGYTGARGVIHVRKCAGVLEAKHLPLLLAAERPLFSWVSISLAVVVRRVASFRRNAVSRCRAASKLRHRAYRRALHHLRFHSGVTCVCVRSGSAGRNKLTGVHRDPTRPIRHSWSNLETKGSTSTRE